MSENVEMFVQEEETGNLIYFNEDSNCWNRFYFHYLLMIDLLFDL